MDIVKKLLSVVVRTYYDDRHVLLYEYLLNNSPIADDALANAIKERGKELNKLAGRLKMDGLIKVETRWELVRNDYKKRGKISRSYFYIDYAHVVDVIKYRIYKIGKMIEREYEDQMANLPYRCPNCEKEYNALDMLSLDTNDEKIPICDICSTELELDERTSNNTGMSEKFTNFMRESKPIVDLLKLTDSIIIPETKLKLAPVGKIPIDAEAHDQLQVSQEKGSASAQVVVEIQKEDFEESEPAQEAAYLAQYYANLAGADGGDANAEEIYSRPVSDGEETEEEEFEVVETVVTQNPSNASVQDLNGDEEDDEEQEFVHVE